MTAKKTDLLLLIASLIFGIAGVITYEKMQATVFPSASIQFDKTKDQILALAKNWKNELKIPGDFNIESNTFEVDSSAETFLDYELGTQEANRVMKEEAPVFYWVSRLARPFNQETAQFYIAPTGKLIGFNFDITKDRKYDNISHDEAKSKAIDFICRQYKWSPSELTLKDDSTTTKPNRIDHSFTFEYGRYDWHGAKLRADMQFSGNQPSYLNLYVHRPEKWERQYSKIRSRNELLQTIAEIFYVLLHPIALFIVLTETSRGNLRFKFAFKCAAVFSFVYLCDRLNDLPYTLAGYNPDMSWETFLLKSLLNPFLTTIFVFTLTTILALAGELIYRKTFPEKLALEKLFTPPGLGSPEGLKGLSLGLTWCAVSLGYQILYYHFGLKCGFWCPIQVDQYQVFGSYFPWIGAIGLGVFASGYEEILYRVMFIGLVNPVVKRFWLANFLQAAGWGFMHSSYAQQPCYARGLELTIEGMMDGFILRRFGLLPCLVSHYLFDAFCSVTPLFKAPPALQVSAAIPLLPILFMLILGLLNRGKQTADMDNKAIAIKAPEPTPPAEKREFKSLDYRPLTRVTRWRALLIILFLLPLAVYLQGLVKPIGSDLPPLKLTRESAIKQALAFFAEHHIDLSGYKTYTSLSSGYQSHGTEFQYMFEVAGQKKTREIADKVEHSFILGVDFVKPMTADTYGAYFDENGKLLSPDYSLSEDTKVPSLSKEEAQKLTENLLEERRPVFYPPKLDDYSFSKKKSERIDHSFTFTVPDLKVAEAPLKVYLSVLGNEPGNMTHAWDLPEKWTWAREKKSKKDEIVSVVSSVVYALLGALFLFVIARVFKTRKVSFRTAAIIGLIATAIALVDRLNNLVNVWGSYENTKPVSTFVVTHAISEVGMLFMGFVGTVFSVSLTFAVFSEEFKHKLKATLLMLAPAHLDEYSKLHRDYWLDAIMLAGLFIALKEFADAIMLLLNMHFARQVMNVADISVVSSVVNCYFGPLADTLSLLKQMLDKPLIIGAFAAFLIQLRLTKFKYAYPIFIVFSALMHANSRYWQDFSISMLNATVTFPFVWFFMTEVVKRNLLALFIYFYLTAALGRLVPLWLQAKDFCSIDLVTTGALFLLPFTYLLYNQRIHRAAKRLLRGKAA